MRRGERARERSDEWPEFAGAYGEIMPLLTGNNPIDQPHRLNLIEEVGNFFERVAYGVSDGSTDERIISDAGIKGFAMRFKAALEPRTEPTLVSHCDRWASLRQWQ